MAEHFGYYDDWKSAILECQRCGWKGSFDEGAVEQYDALMDCSCPDCPWPDTPILAIVSYPTIQESEGNWSRLSESERQQVAARKDFLQQWEAARLVSPDQLPELEGPDLTISWDLVDAGTGGMTVLRHGATEMWHEPALWEGSARFRDVVDILRKKYGVRLADVAPTPASELYLYGDKVTGIGHVQAIRRALKEARDLVGGN
jgi:hypothetical protein